MADWSTWPISGRVRCENHYNVGWAWALDAPFQWMKQVASDFGGTRNGLAISLAAGIGAAGEQRTPVPPRHRHRPHDPGGRRRRDARARERHRAEADRRRQHALFVRRRRRSSRRTTQYFEIFGNRAVYHEAGWRPCFHGRSALDPHPEEFCVRDTERWELYHLADDFSQGVDLAGQYPDKLTELKSRFRR